MRTRKIDEKLLEAVEENPFVPETVERLVGEGANVGVKNIFGWRPFETVARNAYRDRTYVESYAFLVRFHTEKDLMRSIPLFSKEKIGAGAMIALLSGRIREEKNRKALLDVFNSHRSRGVIVSLGVSGSGTSLDAEGVLRTSLEGRNGQLSIRDNQDVVECVDALSKLLVKNGDCLDLVGEFLKKRFAGGVKMALSSLKKRGVDGYYSAEVSKAWNGLMSTMARVGAANSPEPDGLPVL